MSDGQANTPECQIFEAKLTALMADFIREHSMVPVGEIRYFGVDPKGGGRLFLAFFKSADFILKVRTVDGAADILLAPPGAPLRWQDEGWLWPAQAEHLTSEKALDAGELAALRDQLKSVGFV